MTKEEKKEGKKITIIVETIEGESVSIEVNVESKVKHLMDKAMEELEIDPGSATYEILYNGALLNPDTKIEAYNIPNNGAVILQRRAKVG